MFGYAEAPRAFFMARGMARAAGVPLTRGVVEGWITRRDLARIVTRCQTCTKVGDCALWLRRAPEVPVATAPPPAFCANKPELDALAGAALG